MAPKVGRLNGTNCPESVTDSGQLVSLRRPFWAVSFIETANSGPEYAYLRSRGNMWQYDPDEVHPKIVARLYRRFDTFDLDGDNRMTLSEVSVWPEGMRKLVNATDEEIESMKAAIVKVFGDKGVTEEGLPREDWNESNRVFMEEEKERIKNGEQSNVALLGNTYFDVLDEDGRGAVSMGELKTMLKAFKVPEEAAYTFFENDKSGTLEREEMHDLFRKF